MQADVIMGVVTGRAGPEAGVWVVAETTDLPTRMAKIVVTDDQGRYLVPELPKAKYKVWARGYGLADTAAVMSEAGKRVDLQASPARDAVAAAQIYPANYWYAMVKPPVAAQLPAARVNKFYAEQALPLLKPRT